ncbi:helix-turn-helix transcriptional regulator [Aliikangiella coralliicola]|uniref:YafY family transcriptional regulator n=1 Tax=Aliikangiella coralliicola TaxID=2592383 RepID=A0A545UF56_9GAMM|nr:YafY family protein [Aliikangiella coralliicola]TQV88111.1 YafY family transcriptional regulator [Aliikangiella coralliicola]
MRRADRLFQITQILRNKRLVTAKQLSERLEVSERTIYRDIQDLSLSGVPIESEAGVGYMLRHSLDIPPIMFDADELEAILLGVKMIKAWSGNELGQSAESALDKIEAVLPQELKTHLSSSKLFVPNFSIPNRHKNNFEALRQAINKKNIVKVDYQKLNGEFSTRDLCPLGMYYWGKIWTLVAWCQLRDSFRAFRVDRIMTINTTGEKFRDADGKSLDDYIEIQKALYKQQKEWDENQNYGQ